MPSLRRLFERRRRQRVHAAFAEQFGLCVLTGPFRGMRYPADAFRRGNVNLGSVLLGSYEAELHEIVERVVAARFDRIIDVGSARGYYAVGLARRLPASSVEAYDSDPGARRRCRAFAELNGVQDRVEVRGAATAADLRVPRPGRTFVKMDCEGCELALLRPDESPLLRSATILVELHDFLQENTTRDVLARFEPTHVAEIVEVRPRSVDDYPELASLDRDTARLIVTEWRTANLRWALLTPSAEEAR
jgi:hypothetical protein